MKTTGRPESDNFIDRQGYEMTPKEKALSDQQGNLFRTNWNGFPTNDPKSFQERTQLDWIGNQSEWYDKNGYSDGSLKQEGPANQNFGISRFLLDTFKRARSVGYPIGPLLPVLQGYSTTEFGDAGVEPFDPNQEQNYRIW